MICSELDGLQPKLRGSFLSPYMDVDRLIAIKAVKEKPEWFRDVLDSGHSPTSAFRAAFQNYSEVYVSLLRPFKLRDAMP
jgi:hypothetical protein